MYYRAFFIAFAMTCGALSAAQGFSPLSEGEGGGCSGEKEGPAGDVDGDGMVTMADANTVANAYLGAPPISPEQGVGLDVDMDGTVTMADANMIVNAYLTGIPIYRPRYGGKSRYIAAVDEYVPAPGQFVNELPEYEEGDDEAAMIRKCTEYLAENNRSLVTLGAYGGYITFHFDHSVRNVEGERDFMITANAFLATQAGGGGGSSEPGIVMVAQDSNGNGLPDDEWYELAGSCDVDSAGKVVYGYEITYTYAPPLGGGGEGGPGEYIPVPWTDNMGGSGTVERNRIHSQEYFPLWLAGRQRLTFRGTRLPDNGHDVSAAGWILDSMRYGYVDNLPNADAEGCSFDISWAVDRLSRQPVRLAAVDFIRVYSALNQTCGMLGETSTEILSAQDLHFDK